MSTPSSPAELQQAMLALTTGTTETVLQATVVLKNFFREPVCIAALMQQLEGCSDARVRHLAGVLLYKRMIRHWPKLNKDTQDNIKTTLLTRLSEETVRPVRMAVGALVEVVAARTVPYKQWNSLLPSLSRAALEGSQGLREIALIILYTLCHSHPNTMKPHFAMLRELFARTLKDKSQAVQVATLKGVEFVSDHTVSTDTQAIEQLSTLVAPIMQVTHRFLNDGNEDACLQAFQSLKNFFDARLPVLDSALEDLLKLVLMVLPSNRVPIELRAKAGDVLIGSVHRATARVVSSGLVPDVVKAVMQLLQEQWVGGMSMGEDTPEKIAEEILSEAAERLPRRVIFSAVMQAREALLKREKDPMAVKAAILIPGIVAYQWSMLLVPGLKGIVEVCVRGALSGHQDVGQAAFSTLMRLAKHIPDYLVPHHGQILSAIVKVLQNERTHPDIQKQCGMCLHQVSEQLELKEQEVGALTGVLLAVCKRSKDLEVQDAMVDSLKQIIYTVEEGISPYFEDCMALAKSCMRITNEEQLTLRCAGVQMAGALMLACPGQFEKHFQDVLGAVLEGSAMPSHSTREASFMFFADLVRHMGDALCQQGKTNNLSSFITLAVTSIASNEGMEYLRGTDLRPNDNGDVVDDGPENTLDAPGEDDEQVPFTMHMDACDEQVAAYYFLTEMVRCCAHCDHVPGFETAVQVVMDRIQFPVEDLRRGAVSFVMAYIDFMRNRAFRGNPVVWLPGKIMALPKELADVFGTVCGDMLEVLMDEGDINTCAFVWGSLVKLITTYGMAALCPNGLSDQKVVERRRKGLPPSGGSESKDHMLTLGDNVPLFMHVLRTYLEEAAPCQSEELCAPEDQSTVRLDHDEVCIDSVCEALSTFAKAMGPGFQRFAKDSIDWMVPFTKANRDPLDRSMALGTLADVVTALTTSQAPKHLGVLYPMAMGCLTDGSSAAVRRNAAYFLSELLRHCGGELSGKYGEILQVLGSLARTAEQYKLKELLEPCDADCMEAAGCDRCCSQSDMCNDFQEYALTAVDEKDATSNPRELWALGDNVCSAVAKLLSATGAQIQNAEQVIDMYLHLLPLRSDFDECRFVYPLLPKLFEVHGQIMKQRSEKVLGVLCRVLGHPSVDEETQLTLHPLFKALANSQMQALQSNVDRLMKSKDANDRKMGNRIGHAVQDILK